jgi:DNA-binding XRE family transcriptional regulator
MVYLIAHENNFLKIGCTNNIQKRLKQLKVVTPFNLDLLFLVKGSFPEEQKIHSLFNKHHKIGEWYYYHEDIFNYFSTLEDLKWQHGFADSEKIDIIGTIKTHRLNGDLSLAELSEKLNITPQSLFELETREMQGGITLNSMRKVAKAFDKKFEYRFV